MDFPILAASVKFHIAHGLPGRETFHEGDSLSWIDPEPQVESRSTDNFFTAPPADPLERRVDIDIATVLDARYR